MLNEKEVYIKLNRKQALHRQLKNIQFIANVYNEAGNAFTCAMSEIETTKSITKLIETVYYMVINTDKDTVSLNKKITKVLDTYTVDMQDMLSLRFRLDCIFYTKTYLNYVYATGHIGMYMYLVHHILNYLLTYLCKLDKRIITGTTSVHDITYKPTEMLFDNIAYMYRAKSEVDSIINTYGDVLKDYIQDFSPDELQSSIAAYDRVDDGYRLVSTTNALLSGTAYVNEDSIKCMVDNTALYFNKDMLLNRKQIAGSEGVHISRDNIDMYIREYDYTEHLSLVQVNYTYNGNSNIVLIPIGIATTVPCPYEEVGDLILDFYGINEKQSREYHQYYNVHNGRDISTCTRVVKQMKPMFRKANTTGEKAKELAKRLHINIPEGMTLVAPHKRHYYVKGEI